MKNSYVWFFALVLGLTSCSNSPTVTQASPTAIVVEVTRIVQITTTPIPQKTSTPTSTPNIVDLGSTAVAKVVGTPIKANIRCYETAANQGDLNNCALTRKDEMEKQMAGLINAIKERRYYSRAELQTFLRFQSEWENFIKRECVFQSGYALVGDSGLLKGGTMAPTNYNECLVQKYQNRLREMQGLLFDMMQ